MLERPSTKRRPDDERVRLPLPLRRAAALVSVAAYPCLSAGWGWQPVWRESLGRLGYAAVQGAVVLLWLACAAVVYGFRRQLAQAPDTQLDERERTIRDEAYLISYRILGAGLLVCALWALLVAPLFGMDREVDLDVVLSLFFSLSVAAVVLPSAVVAWRDRDDDTEEDPHDSGEMQTAGTDRQAAGGAR